jgi:hypothetical protein
MCDAQVSLASAPGRSPAVHTVELDDEAVLLDEERNVLHRLNASARIVWLLLDGRATVGQIADELAQELGIDREMMRSDVLQIVADFAEADLVEGC